MTRLVGMAIVDDKMGQLVSGIGSVVPANINYKYLHKCQTLLGWQSAESHKCKVFKSSVQTPERRTFLSGLQNLHITVKYLIKFRWTANPIANSKFVEEYVVNNKPNQVF
jgi:hypothetical protein